MKISEKELSKLSFKKLSKLGEALFVFRESIQDMEDMVNDYADRVDPYKKKKDE